MTNKTYTSSPTDLDSCVFSIFHTYMVHVHQIYGRRCILTILLRNLTSMTMSYNAWLAISLFLFYIAQGTTNLYSIEIRRQMNELYMTYTSTSSMKLMKWWGQRAVRKQEIIATYWQMSSIIESNTRIWRRMSKLKPPWYERKKHAIVITTEYVRSVFERDDRSRATADVREMDGDERWESHAKATYRSLYRS